MCQWVSPSTACHGWLSQLILPGCQTSVGRYFDSDGYLGQEEILAEFSKLVEVSSFSNDGNGTSSLHFPVFLFPFMLSWDMAKEWFIALHEVKKFEKEHSKEAGWLAPCLFGSKCCPGNDMFDCRWLKIYQTKQASVLDKTPLPEIALASNLEPFLDDRSKNQHSDGLQATETTRHLLQIAYKAVSEAFWPTFISLPLASIILNLWHWLAFWAPHTHNTVLNSASGSSCVKAW